jgi:hypothetical protein
MSLAPTEKLALIRLLEVYNQRSDLQEVHPEVANGDFRRLKDWAAGVSAKKWKDNSHSVLEPYEKWYAENFAATPPFVSPSLPRALSRF